ncbi:hypothetical protein M0P98_06865 [bacterium]|nr:hypothetical protein [bacterium]
MGNLDKHIALAKEKLDATIDAYEKEMYTVVGDLATKVVEQLVEAVALKAMNISATICQDMSIRRGTFLKRLIRL